MKRGLKNRKIIFRIVALLISFLIAIFIGEILVRVFGLAPGLNNVATKIHRLTNNPILKYELIPFTYDGYETINGQGRRDFHYPAKKAENVFRIAVLGDSVAFGWGNNVWHAHPNILEFYLNKYQKIPRIKFEVWNFGVRGYGTDEEVECLRVKAMATNPDLVIMTYNLNDPDPHSIDLAWIYSEMKWVDEQYLLDIEKAWENKLKRTLVANSALYRMIKYRLLAGSHARHRQGVVNKQGREQVALKTKHNYSDKKEKYFYEITQAYWPTVADSFSKFTSYTDELGIKGQVVMLPGFDDLIDYKYLPIHEKVKDEAEKCGALFFDLFPTFNSVAKNHTDYELKIDFNHPNQEGQRLMGWAMAIELLEKGLIPLGKESYEPGLFNENAFIQEPDYDYFEQYDMFFIEQGLNNVAFGNPLAAAGDWEKALKLNPENILAIKCLKDLLEKTDSEDDKVEINNIISQR